VGFAFEYSEHDLLSLGKSIKILAGDESDPQEIFRGVISGLELVLEQQQEPELIVLAEDALQKARMARHTRLHTDTSLQSLVESVAADLGLRATVAGLSESISHQMQLNESDLAFVRRLLQRVDADLQVVGDELHVSPRAEVRRNEITLEINSQLSDIRVLADLAHQVSQRSAAGTSPGDRPLMSAATAVPIWDRVPDAAARRSWQRSSINGPNISAARPWPMKPRPRPW
jgi:phage protein D